MNYKSLIIYTLISLIFIGCKPKFYHEITRIELESGINFLASDSLKGRYPGTEEDKVMLNYISRQFENAGLNLLAEKGQQRVEIDRGFIITEKNSIEYGDNSLNPAKGLSVLGFSATDTVSASGILSLDYSTGTSGKIIITPLPENLPENSFERYNALRSDALEAADQGASGIIYIVDGENLPISSQQRLTLPIPALAIEKDVVEDFIDTDLSILEALKMVPEGTPGATIGELVLRTEVLPGKLITANTLAETKGSSEEKASEYIIIGAHHDHLGMGGIGSSSRTPDTIAVHYGADDNASGVAGVLELSQHLLNRNPERSILYTTFAAEEMGLHGSKWFAENPPIALEKVQAMINLDMIGRLNEDRQLQIGGIGTSPVFRALLDTINKDYNFSISYSEAGYGPSDHSSFYAKDIPVIFISTGAHTDYHTPADSQDKLNYEGMIDVISYVSDLSYALANHPEKIEFTLAGPKESSGSRGRRGGITFGLMPDMMYDGSEGMPVSFVTEGKPAAIGGMKGGDVIKEVDGQRVGNVYDYMERLSNLKEGQSVIVKVEREGELLDLLLKL